MNKRRLCFAVAVLAAAVGILTYAFGLLRAPELNSVDARFAIRNADKARPNIVLVLVDATTFDQLDRAMAVSPLDARQGDRPAARGRGAGNRLRRPVHRADGAPPGQRPDQGGRQDGRGDAGDRRGGPAGPLQHLRRRVGAAKRRRARRQQRFQGRSGRDDPQGPVPDPRAEELRPRRSRVGDRGADHPRSDGRRLRLDRLPRAPGDLPGDPLLEGPAGPLPARDLPQQDRRRRRRRSIAAGPPSDLDCRQRADERPRASGQRDRHGARRLSPPILPGGRRPLPDRGDGVGDPARAACACDRWWRSPARSRWRPST